MTIQATQLYSAYPSVFGALTIPDTIDTDVTAGVQQIAERAAGSLHVQARGLASLENMVSVTCLNLGHLGTISPVFGLRVGSTSKIQYQRRDRSGGGAFGSSGHLTLVSALGELIPDSIRASQDEQNAAKFSLKFWPLWNGTDVDSLGNPLPLQCIVQALAGTPAIAAMYKLGPTVIDGDIVGAVQEATVNFGLAYKVTRGNGESAAREGALYTDDPTINFSAKNTDLMTAITNVGMMKIDGTVTQYFRRVGQAAGASAHASFSLTNPTLELGNIAANINDDPKPGIIVRADEGGTLAISLTAAMPT